MVWEAVPNFSEGSDRALIAELASSHCAIDAHADPDHDRCVVTMVDTRLDRLSASVLQRIALAVEQIDLRRHAGVHPRVGAADVVPLVPLGGASMAATVAAARRLGERVWRDLHVPVFFYADAGGGRRLADIRAGRVRPDLGDTPHPTAGSVCVGARRPLVAYNVAFDGLPLATGRSIAAALRQLPGVQALAFPLTGGRTQVSMNLTQPDLAAVPAAYTRASELAGRPGTPELVGLCPAASAGPGCDGGLLEARVAGVVALRAAAEAEARGGTESVLLAGRLATEGRSLRGLAAGPEAALNGSERAAALVRVLRAAGLNSPDREPMLLMAARGLRAAVTPATAVRFARRVELLDRWLSAG